LLHKSPCVAAPAQEKFWPSHESCIQQDGGKTIQAGLHGSMEWCMRSMVLPMVLEALTSSSLNSITEQHQPCKPAGALQHSSLA
jgi:hypothetical protein